MDLITDAWIPVRPLDGGEPKTITLQTLLCGGEKWLLCLPRDDMELAAMQLLICLLQVMAMPSSDTEWFARLRQPLSEAEFQRLTAPFLDMFRLDHPDTPFMQIKGVKAAEPTTMDKLLAGLSGATNCAFVNQPGQGDALCSGCTAIALFNQANNAPGFGGGFKSGLRGGTPVTTLIKGPDLRATLWLNVLTKPRVQAQNLMPEGAENKPVWQQPIPAGATIPAASIGLLRGLFWQPAHIELCPPIEAGLCTGCGQQHTKRYNGFLKAKFNFTIEGLWPHPHSPRLLTVKKNQQEEKFLAFTTSAPSWTQLSRIVVNRDAQQKEGHRVAAVVLQAGELLLKGRTELLIGGYRNNQASILERRHDVLLLNTDWQRHPQVINDIVDIGLGYKTALRKALYTFVEGFKKSELKGAGVAVHEVAERHYFRRSDLVITDLLASIDYSAPQAQLADLRAALKTCCVQLFEQVTAPYAHHPKLISTLALARATLYKHLKALQPQGGEVHEHSVS